MDRFLLGLLSVFLIWFGGLLLGAAYWSYVIKHKMCKDAVKAKVAYHDEITGEFTWKKVIQSGNVFIIKKKIALDK